MGLDKITLRSQTLLKRRNLTEDEWGEKNEQLLQRLQSLEVYQLAERILMYYGVKNEADPVPLVSQCIEQGKRVYFPFIDSENDIFHAGEVVSVHQDMELGAFNIMEPKDRVSCEVERIDLVLVPGVVFDHQGNRIGMGKGFYDRFFHQFQDSQHEHKRVGLAFDFQIVPSLPAEEFDERVGWVVSESGVRECKR